MWEEIWKMAVGQGIFAVLFVALLVWVLRKNEERENRYLGVIDTLTEKLGTVEEIKDDVHEIKKAVLKEGG